MIRYTEAFLYYMQSANFDVHFLVVIRAAFSVIYIDKQNYELETENVW